MLNICCWCLGVGCWGSGECQSRREHLCRESEVTAFRLGEKRIELGVWTYRLVVLKRTTQQNPPRANPRGPVENSEAQVRRCRAFLCPRAEGRAGANLWAHHVPRGV